MNDKDIDRFLKHHGIKGQKWGVERNLDDSGGSGSSVKVSIHNPIKRTSEEISTHNEQTKDYLKDLHKVNKPVSLEQIKKNLKENQEKFANKFAPSVDTSKKEKDLSRTGKVVKKISDRQKSRPQRQAEKQQKQSDSSKKV